MTTRDIGKQVNRTVIEALKDGLVPWQSVHGFPRNALSRRKYPGLAAILLMTECQRRGLTSAFWATRSEWELLGGRVTTYSGTEIVLSAGGWLRSSLRLVTVYNIAHVAGDFPVSRTDRTSVDYATAEAVIGSTRADIRYTDDNVAEYWFPGMAAGGDGDFIRVSHMERFARAPGGISAYYHTLFHELMHWTQPGARVGWQGEPEVDELRAEVGSDFLTTELGIPGVPYECRNHFRNHTEVWKQAMAQNPSLLGRVVASADKAVDYILGYSGRADRRHCHVDDRAA